MVLWPLSCLFLQFISIFLRISPVWGPVPLMRWNTHGATPTPQNTVIDRSPSCVMLAHVDFLQRLAINLKCSCVTIGKHKWESAPGSGTLRGELS